MASSLITTSRRGIGTIQGLCKAVEVEPSNSSPYQDRRVQKKERQRGKYRSIHSGVDSGEMDDTDLFLQPPR